MTPMQTGQVAGPEGGLVELSATSQLSVEEMDRIPLVGFNLAGTRPPLFAIRTWSEEVVNYQRLAEHLGPDQPIYTVSPPAGQEASDFPADTDRWADFCIERFGPLLDRKQIALTGWSYAGVVALRIAERLDARGVDVKLVALVDSTLPRRKPKGDSRKRSEAHHFFVMMERLFELEDGGARRLYFERYRKKVNKRARKRVRGSKKRMKRFARSLFGMASGESKQKPETRSAEGGEISVRDTKARERRTPLLMRAIRVAYLKHKAEVTSLPVSLYWTDESRERVGDASLGWGLVLHGDFECCPIPGTHHTLYEDAHIADVTSRLRSSLARAWGQDVAGSTTRRTVRETSAPSRAASSWVNPA